MQVCRATHRYNERQIAAKLGMTPEEYIGLESGVTIMTPRQAEQLSDVYNIEREYFLESAQQLDLLLTRAEVIKHKESEIERLKQFIFVNKDVLLNAEANDKTKMTD